MPDIIGQTIDRYQILEQLGQGGMATVYLAFDLRLDRKVAIKVIRRDVFPPIVLEKVLKRFERESKALAKLNHLNIVSIIDFGTYNDAPYLVMPYIPSGTLKEKLGKPIQYSDAARILAPIARALSYAHSKEIIHRDVKPSNILITQSGDPVLTDFGIAKLLEEVDGNTLTGTGLGLGTPEYMAPEQWQGKADARSDQYALGVIFYEMVTGQKPYMADTPIAIMLKQLNEPLPKLRQFKVDLPEEVEFSILKILAKDPDNRYPDMNAVATMLEKAATQQLPIREQTGYFEDVSDREDEQTRHDQTPISVKVPSSTSEKVPNSLELDVSSEETIDQVESPDNKKISGQIDKNFPEDELSSSTSRKSNGISLVKKLAGVGVGLITLTIVVVTIILSGQSKNVSPVSTDTIMGVVVETSSPSATPQPTKTPTKTHTPTQSFSPTFTPTSTLGIGSTMISEKDGMVMMYVPAEEFIKGSEDDPYYPLEKIYQDAFWIDKYEVTNAQYDMCVTAGACGEKIHLYSNTRTSYYDNPTYADYPVIFVSWKNAEYYCHWAGRRLPSEAEWEKAARGTDGRIYPWGNEIPNKNLLNYYDTNKKDTTPVGSYPLGSSPYGALDMAGNVYEWVADWNDIIYYQISPLENPSQPAKSTAPGFRGGSWKNDFWAVRSFVRNWRMYFSQNEIVGFRCAHTQ